MKRYFTPLSKSKPSDETPSTSRQPERPDHDHENQTIELSNVRPSIAAEKKARTTSTNFSSSDIVGDPGLRMPIEQYESNIRDDVRRAYLLKGPSQPIGHDFPRKQQGNHSRCFQKTWFDDFDWLEYSIEKDAAFCFYCYLFKPSGVDNWANDVFTKEGFSNWKKARESLNKHVGGVNSGHNTARGLCDAFKDQEQSIRQVIETCTNEMRVQYRARLTAVAKVVRFLLSQGLAFRGHDESSSSSNKGNFKELLEWYKNEVEDVCHAIDNAPANNLMTSPPIQKDLVKSCADVVIKIIMDDIGDSCFSLLVDESRDVSIKEQMAVILRFVNKKGQVIERFICVEHVQDTSSASLKSALDCLFARYGLSMSKLRGQGYDGASNMRGQFNGLKALILNENPHAHYIHCFAHQLQLVVVYVSKSSRGVSDFFNYITMIVNIVGASCKRKDALLQDHHERMVEKLEKGEIVTGKGKNQEMSLVRPSDTRWGSHLTTLIRVSTMWDSVLTVLKNVNDDGFDLSQRGRANGLMETMESFDFVFILHLMIKILSMTNDLSRLLQQKDQNIVNAMVLLSSVKARLQTFRENGWETLLEEVKRFCVASEILVPNMEDQKHARGHMRREKQFVTYHHYYYVDIFLVVIDSLATELNSRFNETSTELLKCIACLNPRDSFSNFDHGSLIRLSEIYYDDFSATDRVVLEEQLHLFLLDMRRDEFSSYDDLATLAVKMVETKKHMVYPLVYRLIELALILPVGTATVERAFSAMKIIKTDLRNKISDDWLNDLMICYIERDVFAKIDMEDILHHFQNMRTRKYQLSPLVK